MRIPKQTLVLTRLIVVVFLAGIAAMLAFTVPAARQGYASPDDAPGNVPNDGPLTGVSIEGPGDAAMNVAQVFSATVEPLTATTPITYVWEATGQAAVVHITSNPTDDISFSWNTAVQQVITVTASNLGGSAIATRTVTIVAYAPESVSVAGPVTGIVNVAHAFTATVAPLTATIPFTYFWEATGQTPLTHTSSSPTDTTVFTWNAIGPQLITVTAQNEGAAVSATHVISIVAPNPTPILASISPTMAIGSGPAFTLTVTGTNFVDGSILRWNGSDRVTVFVSTTELQAWIPSTDLLGGSPAKVSVFNPPPGGGTSSTLDFVIRHTVHLPLIVRRWPPIPDVPVLNAVGNPSHDPAYSVGWNAAFLADSYTLQEDTSALFTAPVTVYTGAGTNWPAGGKAPGTYYYRVRASNGYGDSGWSNVQSTLVWPPLPAAPTLNVISNPDYDGNYQVTWSMVTYGDSYTLEEDDNASFTSPATAYSGTAAAWSAGAKAVGTYYYRLKATNVRGDSGWSNVQSAVVWPPLPAAPTLNAISNPDFDGNYQITWSWVTYGDSYTLEEDDNGSFTSPVVAYAGTSAAWTASAKATGTYYYRVKASNARGNSGWSGTQSVVVLPGIHGHVTYNGSPVGSVSLALRFYNGSSWSTYATVSTAANGRYVFNSPPTLSGGQKLYVRYLNGATNSSRLAGWWTRELTSYIAGMSVGIGDFDIANIPLVSPNSGATVSLPTTFWWTRRSSTPSDSYEWDVFEPNTGSPWVATYPLGYVNGVTINYLPSGFYPYTQYGWFVAVWSPDGGYGESYYYRSVKFTNTGIVLEDHVNFQHRPQREDGRPSREEQAVP